MGRRKTARAEGLGEAFVCVGDIVENWAGEDCIVRKLYKSPQGTRRLKAENAAGDKYDGPVAQFGWKGTPTCEDCAEQHRSVECLGTSIGIDSSDNFVTSDDERARLDAIIDEAETVAGARGPIWPA